MGAIEFAVSLQLWHKKRKGINKECDKSTNGKFRNIVKVGLKDERRKIVEKFKITEFENKRNKTDDVKRN